jgi:hypothetical protein
MKMLSTSRPNRPYEIPESFRKYGSPTVAKSLLSIDPLAEAEKITGQSYKTSDATAAIGFGILTSLIADKKQLLTGNDDTTFSMSTEEWDGLIAGFGFKEVLNIGFESEGFKEKFVLAWLRQGVLLRYDTFMGRRNSATIYYCWKPDQDVVSENVIHDFTSSGCLSSDLIWVGNHDARESLRLTLYRLFNYGQFITPWPERPFLWFLHHLDTKAKYDYKAINSERIGMLPPEVIEALGAARSD